MNTHAPSPYSGEGLYDWLRHREPSWASLAILHRLDKETSGLMVFAKTRLACQSLTHQFSHRQVVKQYVFLTDRAGPTQARTVRSPGLMRIGSRYGTSADSEAQGEAITHFEPWQIPDGFGLPLKAPRGVSTARAFLAAPLTGRTHQIRVHAAESGFPILGDTLYGGSPAPRLCLHSWKLALRHPVTGLEVCWTVSPNFETAPWKVLRTALVTPLDTTAWRWIHGAADGWPGWYVDRLGDFLLSQGETQPASGQQGCLETWMQGEQRSTAGAPSEPVQGVYHKILTRHVRATSVTSASPQRWLGDPAPERFQVRENGLNYAVSFAEGYSTGLFLDQRDNRRRILVNHVAAGFPLFPDGPQGRNVLNAFAYTCAFSVCAAHAGTMTCSVDLSRKYLDWGRQNFALNSIPLDEHEFVWGDVFDWFRRYTRNRRRFDLVILDPPTFSQSKVTGVFRVGKDYPELLRAALPLVAPGGTLLISTNAAKPSPDSFRSMAMDTVSNSARTVLQQHYAPQPPDFPITRDEPAHLKSLWLRLK